MWLWIPITLFASFFQTIRTAIQKSLAGHVSTNASAFVRFAYGAPFAVGYLLFSIWISGQSWPFPHRVFLLWILAGSVAQILATSLLLAVLRFRNFPVGIAYSKTEVIQAAIFGFVFLGDHLQGWGIFAIFLSTLGVMFFSSARGALTPKMLLVSLSEKPALLGIASGGLFGLSAIGFRGASLSLGLGNPFLASSYALAFSTCTQTLLMGLYLAWREGDQYKKLARVWRPSLLAGMASVLGSAGWFTAMTLQKVAYVRALATVELVFIFAISIFWFKEKPLLREWMGIALLTLGILLVLGSAR